MFLAGGLKAPTSSSSSESLNSPLFFAAAVFAVAGGFAFSAAAFSIAFVSSFRYYEPNFLARSKGSLSSSEASLKNLSSFLCGGASVLRRFSAALTTAAAMDSRPV